MLQAGVGRGTQDDQDEKGFDLRDLLRALRKHKWVILATAVIGLAIALVDGLTRTPMYRAAATIQIDTSVPRITPFNKGADVVPELDAKMIQTQVELLRGRALAERVIDELGLDPNRGRIAAGSDLSLRASPSLAASAAGRSAGGAPASGPLAMLMDLGDRVWEGYRRLGRPSVDDRALLSREAVVASFMNSIAVGQVPGSNLVRISVVGSEPRRIADVANAVGRTFIAMNAERRTDTTGYAKTFLDEQLKLAKTRLEESEKALNDYARVNSIVMLDEKTSVLNQTFADQTAALVKAEQERLRAEAIYNEVVRSPESADRVLDSKTIQTYKEQKAKLEAEYQTNLNLYKPEYPKMQQLRAQMAEVDARIKAEVTIATASVRAQLEAAKAQEAQVRARVQGTRKEVLASQDRGVQLSLLKREVETNRQMYDGLLQRIKEVGVTSSISSNPITVVDPAAIPLFPYEPDVRRIALVGLMAGLLVGLAWAIIREHMDDTVKHADEVETQFGLPLLGVIPQLAKRQIAKIKALNRAPAMLTVDEPRGSFAESYRSMRTALQFSTAEGAPRQFMVTSSVQGEGKSTTSLSLAINFSQMGKRVLLVDADMRNPSLHKSLDIVNDKGLSNYLSGEGTREQLIVETAVPGLHLLPAGPMPPSPVDLLMGPKLLRLLDKAGEMGFDHVVLDAPPILGIADAIVLGNQTQAIIFVVKAGQTRKSNIRDALRRLRTAGLLPLGVALTRVTASQTSGYGYGYGYDGYYGYGGGAQPAVAQAGTTPKEPTA